MANEKIREEMRKNKIYNWQIAHVLGLCEQTIIRWFRLPLSDEQHKKIAYAIEQIKAGALND